MKWFSVLFLTITYPFVLFSQNDSVAYGKNFALNEGLYLTYSDLRHNWPIPKEKISTKINKNQLDFYTQLIEDESIVYAERDGSTAKINSGKVWGFCQNNAIYININRSFYRIPVFGAICYFVGLVQITAYSPGYNVFINNSGGNATEMREFILEFYTGKLYEFSPELLEELLKQDEVLLKEYSALTKKKRREQASKFIRNFNEKHPVYFPRN